MIFSIDAQEFTQVLTNIIIFLDIAFIKFDEEFLCHEDFDLCVRALGFDILGDHNIAHIIVKIKVLVIQILYESVKDPHTFETQ